MRHSAGLPAVGLGELAAFVAVCEEGSFTRAGQRLHLSQPGTSARVARLERALGVRLVDRSGRDVAPTPAGAELLPVVADALSAVRAVQQRLASAAGRVEDEQGVVRTG